MSNEPQYKMVDGEPIQLTPEEIAERKAEEALYAATQSVGGPKFDAGRTMFEILTR